MRLALALFLVSAVGCATTSSVAARDPGEKELARCRLVGPISGRPAHSPHESVLDEKSAMGPVRVVWIHAEGGSLVRTPEGYLYRCDRVIAEADSLAQ